MSEFICFRGEERRREGRGDKDLTNKENNRDKQKKQRRKGQRRGIEAIEVGYEVAP